MQMCAPAHPLVDDVLGGFSDLMSDTLPGPLAAVYERTGTSNDDAGQPTSSHLPPPTPKDHRSRL